MVLQIMTPLILLPISDSDPRQLVVLHFLGRFKQGGYLQDNTCKVCKLLHVQPICYLSIKLSKSGCG